MIGKGSGQTGESIDRTNGSPVTLDPGGSRQPRSARNARQDCWWCRFGGPLQTRSGTSGDRFGWIRTTANSRASGIAVHHRNPDPNTSVSSICSCRGTWPKGS